MAKIYYPTTASLMTRTVSGSTYSETTIGVAPDSIFIFDGNSLSASNAVIASASWASQANSLAGTGSIYSSNYILTGSYMTSVTLSSPATSSYTLTNSDNGKLVKISSSISAPPATSVIIPGTLNQGFACSVLQEGTVQFYVTGSGGVRVFNRANQSSSYGQYSIVSIIQTNQTTYVLQGDVA